jgi:hypothetical protein
MKQKIIGIMTLLIILSSLSIWVGCAKFSKKEVCTTCTPVAPELIKTVNIATTPVSVGIYEKQAYPNLILGKAQKESKEMSDALLSIAQVMDQGKNIEGLINQRYLPVNYNFFIKGNIRENVNITLKDIDAISLIMYKDFGLHHFLLLNKSEGKLYIDNKYSVLTDGLNYSDKYALFNKVINPGNSKGLFSLITMVSPTLNDVLKKIKSPNDLRSVLKKQQISFANSSQPAFGDPQCNAPCPAMQDQPAECKELVGGPGCVEKSDDKCPMADIAYTVNKVIEFNSMRNTFYEMRDNILANSTNGLAIIEKYKLAGKYIKPNLSEIDLSRMYNFMTLLHQKTNILLTNNLSQQVLIDISTKNDATGMINELRLIDSATEWQQCLDWMQALINQFTNSTASQVFTYISS